MQHVVHVVTEHIKRQTVVQQQVVRHVVRHLVIQVGSAVEHLARIRRVRRQRAVHVGL